MHQVLLKQKRLEVASEGGTVEYSCIKWCVYGYTRYCDEKKRMRLMHLVLAAAVYTPLAAAGIWHAAVEAIVDRGYVLSRKTLELRRQCWIMRL